MSDFFRLYTLDEAEKTVLRRLPPDEIDLTDSVKAGIRAIFGEDLGPEEVVRRIIADVRAGGDAALKRWSERIDRVSVEELAMPTAGAAAALAPDLREAMTTSAERIRAFYRKQPLTSWIDSEADGLLGQVILPIERVGVYVPGGTAPLPSSLLMSAIPAQVAGVKEIIVCTPPAKDGGIPAVIVAAAEIAGIDRVYRAGGAQAIAALAYGTESIPKVDKIVGPGNLFVMLAKRQVYGAVGIDGLLGPTETMVIADQWANPALIAADLLAQAEHDTLASALLVTPDRVLAEAVAREVEAQAARLGRADVIRESLAHRGGAILVPDLDEAFRIANTYAVEHLQLSLRDPVSYLGRVKHAGAIFLGETSFEVLGDYVAGPSHSLPTSGTARFASGLNAWDFVKVTSVIGLQAGAAAALSRAAAIIARAEGLDGHAAAADARSNPDV